MVLPEFTNQDWNAALATRYFTLLGLVLLLAHLLNSWKDERRLIWNAPASFNKYGFLLYRYLLPICLTAVFISQSGFTGIELNNTACGVVVAAMAVTASVMQMLGNGLVIIHVIRLWEYDRKAVVLAVGSYVAAYGTTIISYIIILIRMFDQNIWHPTLRICLIVKLTPLLIVPFAGPVIFKTIMLAALLWNAIDRPRSSQSPILHTLRRDGIHFYVTLLTFASTQLVAAAIQNRRVFLLIIIFCWTLTTITVNRMILSLRQRETSSGVYGFRDDIQPTTVNLDLLAPASGSSMRDRFKPTMPGPSAPIELSRVVEVELSKD